MTIARDSRRALPCFYDGTNAPEADAQMLFDEFMKTVCGDDNYPGTVLPCDHWPGFEPGDPGGQND